MARTPRQILADHAEDAAKDQAKAQTANTSKASSPTKAGEVPTNVKPKVSYTDVAAVAIQHIDALLRGGTEAVMFICSALLVGYLDNRNGTKGVKLSVIRDEFKLMLQKRGLGVTQSNKYIDYASTLAQRMFKECQFGMEMAALLAATTPQAAHDAVTAYVSRHCMGKKTEHGYKLSEALVKLNVLAVWLGKEDDPSKPETLVAPEQSAAEKAKAKAEADKRLADKITANPDVLGKVNADKLVDTAVKVISFDKLVAKHVLLITTADELRTELAAIEKAYKDRIAALEALIGAKKQGKRKPSNAKRSELKAA